MRLPIGGTGINVFRPVYRDGAPTATVAQRRAALIGFATGAFHVTDLAAAATDALPGRGRRAAARAAASRWPGPTCRATKPPRAPIRIADRTWLLVVRDPTGPASACRC